MNAQAHTELYHKLSSFFGTSDFTLTPVKDRDAFRQFYEIVFKKPLYFPQKNIILMVIPLDRLATADDYLNISYYLRRKNIPRPRLFELNRQEGWIFLAKAKGRLLNGYLQDNSGEKEKIYPQLIQFLLTVQNKAAVEQHCPAFQRPLNRVRYLSDFDLRVKTQLFENYYGHHFSENELALFQEFAETVSEYLDAADPVFVHGDFQSGSIFYNKNNSNRPFSIIDFQDACHGTPLYDLVSLLWDSYTELSDAFRQMLLKDYYKKQSLVQKQYDEKRFTKSIDYMVIQRKLHDAGVFANALATVHDKYYPKLITHAMNIVFTNLNRYREFTDISRVLKNIIEARRD